jgi:hypothetical protein
MMMIRTDRLPDATLREQKRRFAVGSRLRKVAAGKWPRGCLLANNFNNEIKHTI